LKVPIITVVTPVLPERDPRHLFECQQSVQAQTVPVDSHEFKFDFDHDGPGATRNAIVDSEACSDSEWFLFLDDDDLLDEDFIETCLPYLCVNDVVYTWCRKNFDYPTDVPFNAEALKGNNFIPVTSLVRASKFREVEGFGDSPYEDWKLWLKLLDAGARFHCIQQKKWTYRRSEEGQNAKDRGVR
jgi:hypothetical protein